MGVQGLWELLSPVGHRVSNEHVRNKVLAVDISIWLTQFVKAMRDAEGAQVRNAHLLGVFRRCVKLLFLSVRPVLIFDGATPALKRRTLASRRAQRERHAAKLRRLAEKMLVNQMKQRLIGVAIKKKRGSRELLPARSNVNEGEGDGSASRTERGEVGGDKDDTPKASASKGNRHPKKRTRNIRKSRDSDRALWDSDSEDRIEPVSGESAARTITDANQLRNDEVFAADLADEEEQLIRDRDSDPILLPNDMSDLDDEAVGSLPPNAQAEVFKQIKLHQRAKHRERMMLKQRDPSEFSKTQIEGFLQFTALNRKISSVRKAINSKAGASQRIASDSSRRFFLDEVSGGHSRVAEIDNSDEDEILPRRRSGDSAAQDVPGDILARIRVTRDRKEQKAKPENERTGKPKKTKVQSRSGVGWASKVLQGHGGLALGGKSALRTVPGDESDRSLPSSESSSDYRDESADKRNNECERTVTGNSDGDENEMEWEDGAVDQAVPADRLSLHVGEIYTDHADAKQVHSEAELAESRKGGADPSKAAAQANKPEGGGAALLDIDDISSSEEDKPMAAVPHTLPKADLRERRDQNDTTTFRTDDVVSRQLEGTEREISKPSQTSPVMPSPSVKRTSGAGAESNVTPPNEHHQAQTRIGKGEDANHTEETAIATSCAVTTTNHASSGIKLPESSTEERGTYTASDQPSMMLRRARSDVARNRKGDEEEDSDLQLAIALSMKTTDTGTESQSAPAKEGRTDLVSIDDYADWEEARTSVDQAQRTFKHQKKSVPNSSRDELEDIKRTTAELPVQKLQSETERQRDGSRDTDPIVSETIEHEASGTVVETDARHFEATTMSVERMKELREELNLEAHDIQRRKNTEQGAAESVSDEMYSETRDLLKLFGIPYLEAPTEAEAQCAFLNMEKVVDGVITEDSDAFLFGAKTVYRRLFSEGRFAEAYEAEHIEGRLGLNRELLIRLAYLLGSDYTSGIRGVGLVNSMEILEAFPGESGLEEFREWMSKVTVFDEEPSEDIMKGTSLEAAKRRFCWKHRNMKRNWEVPQGFPNIAVAEAYRRPHIDESKERFRWGKIDYEGLARFCWDKFGWEQDRFNDAVGPLRKKMEESSGLQQRTIDEFFKPHRFAKIRSERLQKAVKGMVGDEAEELMATIGPRPKKRKAAAVGHLPPVLPEEEKAMVEALDKAEQEQAKRRRGK